MLIFFRVSAAFTHKQAHTPINSLSSIHLSAKAVLCLYIILTSLPYLFASNSCSEGQKKSASGYPAGVQTLPKGYRLPRILCQICACTFFPLESRGHSFHQRVKEIHRYLRTSASCSNLTAMAMINFCCLQVDIPRRPRSRLFTNASLPTTI